MASNLVWIREITLKQRKFSYSFLVPGRSNHKAFEDNISSIQIPCIKKIGEDNETETELLPWNKTWNSDTFPQKTTDAQIPAWTPQHEPYKWTPIT